MIPERVEFVCTDRRRHAPRRVGEVAVDADGGVSLAAKWLQDFRYVDEDGVHRGGRACTEHDVTAASTTSSGTFVFRCPTCRRDVRLTAARMTALTAALAPLRHVGASPVDISTLPG